jgi:hypothetical protein
MENAILSNRLHIPKVEDMKHAKLVAQVALSFGTSIIDILLRWNEWLLFLLVHEAH